jgi:hypothetical protein
MSKISFDKYLFRCSSLGKLMTYPTKDTLSAGPKTFLGNLFKEELFGKSGEIKSKYLSKGLLVEQESIELYNSVNDTGYKKNTKRYNNEHITGEPDIVSDALIDIKSSWDHTTFPLTNEDNPNKDHYWQLQGYMALTKLKTSKVVYCLVDTPDELIHHEIKVIAYKLGVIDLPEELEDSIWDGLKFAKTNPKDRVKEFVVERNQDDIDSIYKRVELARGYLNKLNQFLN